MKKPWKDIDQGESIQTKAGEVWEVVSNEKAKAKGQRSVKLRRNGTTVPRTVDASAKMRVVEAPVVRQVRRGGMEPERVKSDPSVDFGRLFREAGAETRAAREASKPERSADPWQVDPLDTITAKVEGQRNAMAGGGGPWEKPKGKAEKVIADTLKGELIGVQTSAGSPYSVPPVDPSTIKGHLFLMHDTEAKSLSWEELVEVHDRDHARADSDAKHSLPVPHHHAPSRPAID